jgi:hypothetical protein
MKNFRLVMAAEAVGKATVKAVDEVGTADNRPKRAPNLQKYLADSGAVEAERVAILKKFNVTGPSIGESSKFGKIYLGTAGGRQVAIKLERAGSVSNELAVLRKIQAIRDKAPSTIQSHLPVIYLAEPGTYWNYYAMERLEEAPQSVKEDIFGTHYAIANTDDSSAISKNPEEANISVDAVDLDLNTDKWMDAALIGKAFDIWYVRQRRDEVFYEIIGFDSPDSSEFEAALRKSVISAIGELASQRGGKIGVAKAGEAISNSVENSLKSEWKPVWAELSASLPELLYVIARTGWVSRWHPWHSEEGYDTAYKQLHRTSVEKDYRRHLQKTLNWLASHGIMWGDVHSGNIMMRPGSGEIVFIDFGLYGLAKKKASFSLFKS